MPQTMPPRCFDAAWLTPAAIRCRRRCHYFIIADAAIIAITLFFLHFRDITLMFQLMLSRWLFADAISLSLSPYAITPLPFAAISAIYSFIIFRHYADAMPAFSPFSPRHCFLFRYFLIFSYAAFLSMPLFADIDFLLFHFLFAITLLPPLQMLPHFAGPPFSPAAISFAFLSIRFSPLAFSAISRCRRFR